MSPPLARAVFLLFCLLTLFLLVLFLENISSPADSQSQSTSGFFFPSSAIISLTEDNSTFFVSRPAAFGPSLPKSGLNGELFVLEDGQLACDDVPDWDAEALTSSASPASHLEKEDGTDDVLYSSTFTQDSVVAEGSDSQGSSHADIQTLQQGAEIAGKMVLVTRGGCGFFEKVMWVQRRGGIALIVGDYRQSPGGGSGGLVTMYAKGDTSNVTIPSVFTTHNTAFVLTKLLSSRAVAGYSSDHSSLPIKQSSQTAEKPKEGHSIKWPFFNHGFDTPFSDSAPTGKPKITTATTILAAEIVKPPVEVEVDSSHRPPMSGELEGIVYIPESGGKPLEKDIKGNVISGNFDGRDRLWITLTPTRMSTSPFFDTLLVLVVSPLITLTIVYALLLIRSRIRRRRWRAPKSVVDRLPVRIYQSLSPAPAQGSSSSSSSASPVPPRSSSLPSGASNSSPRSRSRAVSFPIVSTHCQQEQEKSLNDGQGAVARERAATPPRVQQTRKRYEGGAVDCVVCLEEYVDGVSRVMKLPCGHEFHVGCITPWLTTRRRTCPICKSDVVRGSAEWNETNPTTTTVDGISQGGGTIRHSDVGEATERTPLVQGDDED